RARRVVFPHNDGEALAALLASESGEGQSFIVVESLFSVDGDRAPLEQYAKLCRRFGAMLIVDEAHAIGVHGDGGVGLMQHRIQYGVQHLVQYRTAPELLLSINAAGKALGVAGAFVAGPEWAIEYLLQRARPFIFSTAAPPAVAAAIDE